MARGLLTRNELRSKAWRPLFRDIYADSRLAISHRMRCAAAARWLIPEGAAIAGPAAAALHGGLPLPDRAPLDILARPDNRFGPVAGLRVHVGELRPGDLITLNGLPVTSPERTCWDLARWLDTVEAVVAIDTLLARRRVTAPKLRDYALSRAGQRGWRLMLRAVDLADAGAESPQESRVRVRLVLAGLPRPETQYIITDNGRFVARVDLAWPEFKVAVEYDGVWHNDVEQFHRDRRRLNQILGDDWIVLHVTARRLQEDFDGFLAEVRTALRSRRRRQDRTKSGM